MIHKKEFYFIRHGQTDFNIMPFVAKEYNPVDIPLNETGRKQAQTAESIIATLPIRTICCSPLRRAQETKQIISPRLEVPHHDIEDLSECSYELWKKMIAHGPRNLTEADRSILTFVEQVKSGVNEALSKNGPVLIVAHGGVHWAICALMQISDHNWSIDNCVPVHFRIEQGSWSAKKF